MSFDWAEFFTLAAELTDGTKVSVSEEARWRCAISRSYYSVYHLALSVAQRDGYRQPANAGVHESLIQYYQNHRNTRRRVIGVALDELRTLRVKADYQRVLRVTPISNSTTRTHLQLAQETLANLRRLP